MKRLNTTKTTYHKTANTTHLLASKPKAKNRRVKLYKRSLRRLFAELDSHLRSIIDSTIVFKGASHE